MCQAIAAEAEVSQRRDQVREALGRDLEAARYAADRAFRQYDATDPNRLVADELEMCWNKALARVAEIKAKIAGNDAVVASRAGAASLAFNTLAGDLRAFWMAPMTDTRLKKYKLGLKDAGPDHTPLPVGPAGSTPAPALIRK